MIHFIITNLQRMLKDKKAIIGMLITPALIVFLLKFIMPSDITYSMKIGVATLGQDQNSHEIIQVLEGDSAYEVQRMTQDALEKAIKTRQLSMGVIIPENVLDYGVDIVSGEEAPYQTLAIKMNQLLEGMKYSDKSGNTQFIYSDYNGFNQLNFIIGFIINFLMFSLLYITNDLMDLKKYGVLKRSYTAPYTGFELLASLLISMFCLMAIQLIIINLVIYILYGHFMINSVIGGLLLFTPFMLLVLSLGILIGRYTKNQEMTPLIANLVIIPLAMISGTFFPEGMMPSFFQKLAFLSPQYWVVDGLDKINEGHVVEILPNTIILSLLALCLLLAGSYKFDKLLEA